MLVRLTTLLWNIRSGRIASSPIRRSHGMKDVRAATDRASSPSDSGEDQPQSRPFSASSRNGTTERVSSAAPTKSSRCAEDERGRWSLRETTT